MEQTKEKHDQYYEMAHAPVGRVISKLAVPTIISMLVTSIYNMADTFFVSQLGTSASGAVGIIFSAMAIIQALSFMIGIGSGNYIARLIGAGNRELAEKLASIGFFTGFGMGLVITVLGTANIHALVMMLGSTVTIAPYAEAYASYILLAAPFMMTSFIMNNILRFQGKALFAMVGITTGGILNIVLDPVFISAWIWERQERRWLPGSRSLSASAFCLPCAIFAGTVYPLTSVNSVRRLSFMGRSFTAVWHP